MIITVGADVEVFARNKEGKAIALCGKIGGTKQKPKQLPDLAKGYMVQEDNVSLEYNIPPSNHVLTFRDSIDLMHKRVSEILDGLGLVTSQEASISFDEDQLQHPQAKVFGCEPDYCAWSKMENKKPKTDNKNLRTAGGHVHVGTQEVDMILGIRAMDLFLGVPSVLLDDSPSSVERRKLYGKAGAMRPKPYGFEYRVLSNFWMFDTKLSEWVFNNTKAAMEWARKGFGNALPVAASANIQECINTGNKEMAKEIIAQYGISMPNDKKPEVKALDLGSLLKEYKGHDFYTFAVPPVAQIIPTTNNPVPAPGTIAWIIDDVAP